MLTGGLDGRRIQLIDALRGLALVLMCLHHLAIDLCMFGWLPVSLVYSDWVYGLHLIFASLFVLLSGVSSRFSRGNIRRGVKVLVLAALLSLATYFGERLFDTEMFICWGILHMLGFCMVFYGLLRRWLDRFDWRIAVPVYLAAYIALAFTTLDKWFTLSGGPVFKAVISALIARDVSFTSADYFAVFPWIFMFLIGAQLGALIRERRFPDWFYSLNPPYLPSIGRKSLLIYLFHQPVLYGICYGIYTLLN